MQLFSAAVMPITIALILFFGLYRGIPVFDAFLKGANQGLSTSLSILPSIVGLVCAVTMLRESGALDLLCHGLSVITKPLGFPEEILPLALLRPVSGGASTALFSNILEVFGPDSFPGRVASVLSGSSETTFYTIAVYFAATKAQGTRHTLAASLAADLTATVLSVVTVRLFLLG